MKDWIKETILGLVLLAIAGLVGYKTYIIAKEIGAKLGICALKILAFPILEGLALFLLFIGLIIVWIGIEDKRLEKELKELEKELEGIEEELEKEEEEKKEEKKETKEDKKSSGKK